MSQTTRKIRIFGDSIMKGAVYNEEDDRYITIDDNRLTELEARLGIEIQNNTLFGCTVAKGRQLLQRAIAKGLDCDTALLEFGGNDCDYRWDEVSERPQEEHQSNTPVDIFEATLKTMITTLKAMNVVPVLMTLPPIISERYLTHICRNGLDRGNILQFLGEVGNIERRQELYSLKIAMIALETQTQLIDIRSGFLARRDCSSLICADGIHPNERGHELIMHLLSQYGSVRIPA